MTINQATSTDQIFKWPILLGIGLTAGSWYPYSTNPGVVGKFLGLYFLGATLCVWIISRILTGNIRIASSKVSLALIAVVVSLVTLSALNSGSSMTILGTSSHREGAITFLLYAIAYISIAGQDGRINIQSIGAALSISTIFSYLLGYTAIEQSFSAQYGNRLTGSFGEPNFLAGFLILAIPIIFFIALHGSTLKMKVLGSTGLAAALGQLWLTQARAGFAALTVAALLLGLIAWRRDKRSFSSSYFFIPLAIIPTALLTDRFSLASLSAGTIDRLSTWRSISETWQYIFIGPGPDRFQFATQNRHALIGPHNTFINYAGNIGWIATAAYALLILFILVRLGQTIRKTAWSESIPMTMLMTSLAAYSFFSVFSYTRSYVNILFWLLLGLASYLSSPSREWKLPVFSRVAGGTVSLVIIGITLITSMQMLVGGYHVSQAIYAQSDTQTWNHLTAAIKYEPTNMSYRRRRGQLGREFMNRLSPGSLVEADLVRAGIEDWEFLYSEVWNDANSYRYLSDYYLYAEIPAKRQLSPPASYSLSSD